MSDPRDRDLYGSDLQHRSGANSAWGWIAGAAFVVIALVLIFGYGMNTDTASNRSGPPMTTGAGTSASPPAATPAPSSPSTPANPGSSGPSR